MVKSSKTGRELTPEIGAKVPKRVERFFALFGIRPPDPPAENDDDSDA